MAPVTLDFGPSMMGQDSLEPSKQHMNNIMAMLIQQWVEDGVEGNDHDHDHDHNRDHEMTYPG